MLSIHRSVPPATRHVQPIVCVCVCVCFVEDVAGLSTVLLTPYLAH
jgi:hypothetical protein